VYTSVYSRVQRGALRGPRILASVCSVLESVVIKAINGGAMTKDLALLVHGDKMKREHWLSTNDFMTHLQNKLSQALTAQNV